MFLLLFSVFSFMAPFLLSNPLPCCPSLSTSPEVKSHLLIHACHTSNAPPPLPSPLARPDLPSLCLGSTFFIFFRRLSIPLRSVMPYSKAIFSYSLGWAFLSSSHTSISGSSFSGFFFLSVKEKGYVCHWDWRRKCLCFFKGNNHTVCLIIFNSASYFLVAFSRALKSRSPSSSPASLCVWKQTYSVTEIRHTF